MIPIDYSASFVMGNLDANRIRFQIESRVVIDNGASKREYYQCCACYREKCFAKKGSIFYSNGYEFIPVFGEDGGVIFRNGKRMVLSFNDMFGGYEVRVLHADVSDYKVIRPRRDLIGGVVKNTRSLYPLVAQTELMFRGTKVTIEYPVKTMNTTATDFQVDTGPVIFPDLRKNNAGDIRDRFFIAHIGFNTVERVSLAVADEKKAHGPVPKVSAMTVSVPMFLEAHNRLFVVNRRGLK